MSFQSHSRSLNTPEDEEMYVLPPQAFGKRVHFEEELRVPHAGVFSFYLETHTLGDLTRMQLLRSPHVVFAGYSVPHPLEFKMQMRIQVDGLDNSSPGSAMDEALDCLINEFASIEESFESSLQQYQSKAFRDDSMSMPIAAPTLPAAADFSVGNTGLDFNAAFW